MNHTLLFSTSSKTGDKVLKFTLTKYCYTCPKPLGYLEIDLDILGKVRNAIFVNKKQKEYKDLPTAITKALDDYFFEKKDLPNSLISKEILGTDFQKSIWLVISTVTFGVTITYTDIAEQVGKPYAAHASGTACGKNPIALFIPCHRVVRKKDEDYGYSWGVKRKKWLLNFEK